MHWMTDFDLNVKHSAAQQTRFQQTEGMECLP